ncbi:hypothetical protein ACTMTJ_42280 [Phytohabitans sp. LJ34]|uniref:hypothetical protein n=1 Tax=Phytohabitans sp. LJ34 TaxID=3452217 RepID=UPI003F8950A6
MTQPFPVADDRSASLISAGWPSQVDPTWAPTPPTLRLPPPPPRPPAINGAESEPPDDGPPPPANPASFADPALIAGRPAANRFYIFVLALAALADIGTFSQVIQFVMPLERDFVRWAVVIGFTACVLFLSHIAGVQLRVWRAERAERAERTANARPATRKVRDRFSIVFACTALGVWLLLGVFAFHLRWTWDNPTNATTQQQEGVIPAPAATPAPLPTLAPTPTSDTGERDATAAADFERTGSARMFLALYLGTGLAATIGGYLTHNPARAAYARAKKAYEAAVGSAAEAARVYEEAKNTVEHLEQRARDSELIRWAEQVEILHAGEELKQRIRARIAERAQDAALTDAYFPERP